MSKKVIDSIPDNELLINKVSQERFEKIANLENKLYVDKDQLQLIKVNIENVLKDVKALPKCPIPFNDDQYKEIHDRIVLMLLQLADMSMFNSKIKDILEDEYNFVYATMPKIAEQLIGERIYVPFFKDIDVLKNKCFNTLEILDDYYFKTNKKIPPNV